MFIVRPDLTDEDVDKLVSTFESNIANAGATLKKTDRMGKRRLAYLVRKEVPGIELFGGLKCFHGLHVEVVGAEQHAQLAPGGRIARVRVQCIR